MKDLCVIFLHVNTSEKHVMNNIKDDSYNLVWDNIYFPIVNFPFISSNIQTATPRGLQRVGLVQSGPVIIISLKINSSCSRHNIVE